MSTGPEQLVVALRGEYIIWPKRDEGLNPEGFVHLYPRRDGRYGHPKPTSLEEE